MYVSVTVQIMLSALMLIYALKPHHITVFLQYYTAVDGRRKLF